MDFFIKMSGKRSDTTGHYINNRMRNMIFPDMLAAHFQRNNIIINCLCRSNLRNINFETVGIMEFKFMVVDVCHALKLVLLHATIAIGFTGNMIFNVFFILVILCELVNKCLVTSVSP